MEIIKYPRKVLRKECSPVRQVDDDFYRRAVEMLEVMYEEDGLGLAGPQVDWAEQIVTLDVDGAHEDPRIYLNPRIVESDGVIEMEEGCLSLPGIRVKVPRSERIVLVTYTVTGERMEMELEGLAAVAWQHEIDHLHGMLIIDRIPPARLMTVREQLRHLEQDMAETADRQDAR